MTKKTKKLQKRQTGDAIDLNDLLPCPLCYRPAKEIDVSYPESSNGLGVWFTGVRCSSKNCALHKIILRKKDWQKRVPHPDTIRLDWLNHNASKLGLKPDWEYGVIEESGYKKLDQEFTDFRKKIDDFMKLFKIRR